MINRRVPIYLYRRNPKLLESYLKANQYSNSYSQSEKAQPENKVINVIETLKEEPAVDKTEVSPVKEKLLDDKALRDGYSYGWLIIPIIIIIAIIIFTVQWSEK
jgi:hypothetical protein